MWLFDSFVVARHSVNVVQCPLPHNVIIFRAVRLTQTCAKFLTLTFSIDNGFRLIIVTLQTYIACLLLTWIKPFISLPLYPYLVAQSVLHVFKTTISFIYANHSMWCKKLLLFMRPTYLVCSFSVVNGNSFHLPLPPLEYEHSLHTQSQVCL